MRSPAVAISEPFDVARPEGYFKALACVIERMPLPLIDDIVALLLRAFDDQRTVFVYGNGGSAALACHCACDMGKGTATEKRQRLRIVSLTGNAALMTAWANDCGYDRIFVEQLRNLLQPGDISFAISGSGNSPNVLKALQFSREIGAVNVGLTGFQGGRMRSLCDLCLVVPSDNMQLIEDMHVSVSHAVFSAVRQHLANSFGSKTAAVAAD